MTVQNAEVKKEKPDVWKKTVNILFTVFIVILILMFVVYPLIAVIYLSFEDKIDKWRLDNEYINSDFEDFKTVELEHFDMIVIPNEWELTETDFQVTLRDSEGSLLASGKIIRNSSAEEAVIFEECTGEKLENYTFKTAYGFFSYQGMHFGEYVSENGNKYYCLLLCSKDYRISPDDTFGAEMLLFFNSERDFDATELSEISQAIVYWKHFCYSSKE